MKTQFFFALGLGIVTGLAAAPSQNADHVPGRLLVQVRRGANGPGLAQAFARSGAKVQKNIGGVNVSVLQVPEAAIDHVAEALTRTGMFTFVERDHIAHGSAAVSPNDPSFPSQWHLAAIQAPSAWGVTKGNSSVTIAIIDSGADWTHPDLAPRLVPGWNYLTGTSNTQDSGANGGHGTAVSGSAGAATDNGTGVAGVTWANRIMPLEVLDASDWASYSNIASAITYAADHGVRIINISICGTSSSSTLQSAVDYAWNKGTVVFAAAGNNSSSAPIYPAACNNAVAVSATDQAGVFASFSNYGSWIDISAPGNNILTTYGGGYGYWYGTSFASPITAGVAALVLSVKPGLSNSGLVSLLEQNADDLGAPGWDQYFGYGQVNAYKAVLAAQGVSAADTTPPSVSISSPGNGASVSGTIQVQGTATDNVGLTAIQLYIDGQLASSAGASPFSFSWATTAVANGYHTLTVNASDAAGNTGSASVSVNVNNAVVADTQPPTVSLTQPLSGSTVSGNIRINASATDNVGVAQVTIYVDGVATCTDTATPYSCTWNSRKAAHGTHTIGATAWDAAGNVASTALTVYK